MSTSAPSTASPSVGGQPTSTAAERRKVVGATIVGTTVEWYDFFIYANAAGLVFQEIFFKPAGPEFGQLLSFVTIGISFLFRPLGAFLAGHFGDRLGRKPMLVITLLMMGAATTLIGVLPTYADAGVIAPVLLILLRVLQGISAGGEWGGAVLMSVEHAPDGKRGQFGMYPQLGVPLGMLLASGVLALMSGVISPGAAFQEWGWRVPFLLSILLVLVGYLVRRTVEESPVFQEIAELKKTESAPTAKVFRRHGWTIVLLALLFAGNNAAGYMTTGGYMQSLMTTPIEKSGLVQMDRTSVLVIVAVSAVVWFIFTLVSGFLTDAIGRRNAFIIAWIAQLAAIWYLFITVSDIIGFVQAGGSANERIVQFGIALCAYAIPLGLSYGPISIWYAESIPASLRYSGVSVGYALGAIVGGAFAPLISQALVNEYHTVFAVAIYLSIMTLLAFIVTCLLPDRTNVPLGHEFEESGQWERFRRGDDTTLRPAEPVAAG